MIQNHPYAEELRALRDTIAERDQTIRRLRNALQGDFVPPEAWKLTWGETILAQLLARHDAVTPDMIAVAFDANHSGCRSTAGSIRVHTCNLRGKLRPFGVIVSKQKFGAYRVEGGPEVMARHCVGVPSQT